MTAEDRAVGTSALPSPTSLTRRQFLASGAAVTSGIGLVGAGLLGPACASVGAPSPSRPLRLGLATNSVPLQPNSVLWLAKDDGFYRREGLDVSLVELTGTPEVIMAMLAGELDVGNVGTDRVISLTAAGKGGFKAINSPDPRSFYLLASRREVGSLAELAGRTLAVSALGGLDDSLTSLALQARGVDLTAVRVVAIGSPQARTAALLAGRADAATFALGTWLSISAAREVHVLLDETQFFAAAPLLAKVNAAHGRALAERGDDLRRLTVALLRAIRHYAVHQDAWVAAVRRRRPDVEASRLSELWRYFQPLWPLNGGLDPGWVQATADHLYRLPSFKKVPRVRLSAWLDERFIRGAINSMGALQEMVP